MVLLLNNCVLCFNGLQLPHTSKEVLPLRPGPAPNSTQPVNIVRPLRPAPSPQGARQDPKVARPPLPASKPPGAPPKSPQTPQRLTPPKKPLPLNPTRSPLVRFYTFPNLFRCRQNVKLQALLWSTESKSESIMSKVSANPKTLDHYSVNNT